jgi:hypothetical protein
MADNVTINVQQDNDIVNIVSSQVTEVIDINVAETTEEVTLNITEEIIQVNINKVTGGGGNQTLAETIALGNNTGGNDILLNNADALLLENSSLLQKGTYDFGQQGGISRICGVGFEDMWQGGIRHVFDGNGFIRNSTNAFNIVPNYSFDITLRFKVGSIWTLDDGTNYICTDATEGDAVWELYTNGLVPYTGANDDVNIGNNDLYTKKVFLFDEVNDNYGSIHYADGDLHIEDADGHKLLVIEDGFMQLHLSDTIQSNLFTTNLTQNRDHYLPDNSGTIALTSDITGTNSGTNTGDETATSIKTKLGITTLSGSNTGDQDLSNLVVKNIAITGATKTKITYDAKGLVTSGADATTADIADSTNKRYVTDANLITIGNQSGTNTGDETTATIKSKLGAATTSNDGYLTSTNWNTFNKKLGGLQVVYPVTTGQGVTPYLVGNSSGSTTGVANRIYLIPLTPSNSFTSSSFNIINVTGAIAGSNVRVLIYSDLNGKPDGKLYESADISTATTGIKTISASFSFVAGTTYWYGLHYSSSPTLTSFNGNSLPILSTAPGATTTYFQYTVTATFGSAPANITTSTIGGNPIAYINITVA